MMVAVVSESAASKIDPQNSKTSSNSLLLSEKDNCNGVASIQRKPKSKVVPSRYMSPSASSSSPSSNSSSVSSSLSSSKRSPSPLVPRNSNPLTNGHSLSSKRSTSVDRRRPIATGDLSSGHDLKNGCTTDASAATKLLVTSTRRLSVSFQGEGFSLPISKTKVAPSSPNVSSARKGTPERRRTGTPLRGKNDKGGDQTENSKIVDMHRWPTRNSLVNPLSRSFNCGASEDRYKLIGSGDMIRELQQSIIDERRPSLHNSLSLDLSNSDILKAVQRAPDGNSAYTESSMPSEFTASDSDSVSSGSTSGVQEYGGASHGQNVSRGIASLARFWQETNSRLRRLHDPGSLLSTNSGSKSIASPKLKRYTNESSLLSPQTMSSPIRGGIRTASPGKIMSPVGLSPSRGHSPSRIRNAVSTISNSFVETPSVLSFAVDVRRGKVGENQIVDAHVLRLLYNRHLQWRFVNARTEGILLVQEHNLEKNLWNAWITISDLRDTVTKRRHRLQLLGQTLKLAFILKGQMAFLEDWASVDKDHSFSMLGAIEALKASTLRLPAVGGTTADMHSLKEAIGSAYGVMQAITSSLQSFVPMIEGINLRATELANVTTKERASLEHCTNSISLLAAKQVKDCSLRTQILQLKGHQQ